MTKPAPYEPDVNLLARILRIHGAFHHDPEALHLEIDKAIWEELKSLGYLATVDAVQDLALKEFHYA